MNHDEFAFFNHQLAAMLQDGIPLEGGLKELAAGMRDRKLKAELEQLGADLAQGTPLPEAISRRALPELYRRMVQIGVRSHDLPGMLTLLADHYQRVNSLWTRLKGLMVYPVLVIAVSLGLTLLLSGMISRFLSNFMDQVGPVPPGLMLSVWFPPILFAIALALAGTALGVPAWRARWRWRLPAFREASLAQLASALAMMLRNGLPLAEALALAEALESGSPAGSVLGEWRAAVEGGRGKPVQWQARRPFPAMFVWLVQRGGENPAAAFQKAAEIYQARANYRAELALYAALPLSILFLGQMILWQVVPLARTLAWFMQMLGDFGG
jgi:general secretion pathway protein F